MNLDDICNKSFNGGEKYTSNPVFNTTSELIEFYDFLSFNSLTCCDGVLITKNILSISNPIFSSIKGTIESIGVLLKNGRINDSFALIRKYEDAVLTSIYIMQLIENESEKFNTDLVNDKLDYEFFSNKINTWITSFKYSLKANELNIGKISQLESLNKIFKIQTSKDKSKGKLETSELAKYTNRQFCNNNVHYNSLRYFIWNDNQYFDSNGVRLSLLDKANKAISNIFTFHLSYIFFLKPEYLVSSDYIDNLDMGKTPEEGSQHYISSISQEMFNKYIKSNKDLSKYLLENTWLIFV